MIPIDRKLSDLASLIAIFYAHERDLGGFTEVEPDEVPAADRRLLDHHSHMTVALEKYHASPLELRVIDVRENHPFYARKISLVRKSDGRAALFGLVRLDTRFLPGDALAAIRNQTEPLGHVLIRFDVLREVERLRLWRVSPGQELRDMFQLAPGQPLFGRTALIHCNSQPAIELLEIVQAIGDPLRHGARSAPL